MREIAKEAGISVSNLKLALLGDIHSNYMALERCLSYCQEVGVDGYIFLGDYVSDCPYPQKTLTLIKNICEQNMSWIIRGNREDYQIMHHEQQDDWQYCSNSGSLLYTYENLTAEDIAFFQACDISMKISIDNYPNFTICHGSPTSTREILHIGSTLAQKHLKQSDTDILICAHTHLQGLYKIDNKMLINPGSVGIAIDSEGKSQFAILHGRNGEWQPEFLSLDYDIEQFISEFNNSDLPSKSKTFAKLIQYVLRTGVNILPGVYSKTEELTLAAQGTIPPGNMPDEYWEQAYQKIIANINQTG
jgi:putative phosphoesterase